MNQEDKKRFARYRKGYIPSLEDENEIFNNKKTDLNDNSKQKTILGYINNINVNSDILIKNITSNKT